MDEINDGDYVRILHVRNNSDDTENTDDIFENFIGEVTQVFTYDDIRNEYNNWDFFSPELNLCFMRDDLEVLPFEELKEL